MSYELPEANTLDEQTRTMNELFNSLIKQGFSRHEALHIVAGNVCCPLTHEEDE